MSGGAKQLAKQAGDEYHEEGYIDCKECGAKESIKVEKDSTPGFKSKDYYPCEKCGANI